MFSPCASPVCRCWPLWPLWPSAHDPAQPRSMTLMAGPIDTRVNPDQGRRAGDGASPIRWFEQNLIGRVPGRYPGAGRRVYPGFVQLTAFVSMNVERHVRGPSRPVTSIWRKANSTRPRRSNVLRRIFRRARPDGRILSARPSSWCSRSTRCAQGRTRPSAAAQSNRRRSGAPRCSRWRASATTSARSARPWRRTICARACASMKRHHLQTGVGHYGVFSGRRWESQVYPQVRNAILATEYQPSEGYSSHG